MKQEDTLLKDRIKTLAHHITEVYFIVPLVLTLVLYYVFFRYHRYVYETDAFITFLTYFGVNIFIFALVIGYLIYRYNFYLPLQSEGYSIEDNKNESLKIILTYTVRYLPIIFLLLQVFFYAVNIYTAPDPILVDTKVLEVGDKYIPLAPKNWIGIHLTQTNEMTYLQTMEPMHIGDIYKKEVYQGLWLKYAEM